ncbi:molybdenum cofactor biosynthesis protein A [Nitritalea halalkaliphila LW7]|uniref:GTP 3',8-cyclase n=1 Tax=Nitritalea halalkaliphila LW7 TaxID=1189621 RepID=I5C3T5_9BACT|nr:GTP 3',8-cyclase MoaA [Nitritalea halalkaliphila]EIM76487.1 molybdenum cofactor biosynthesis protein A [Nitritalea halalkaliphila LW7]
MNTLYDNHGRPISYLRLSVTDRCNLRCFYCMPAEGVPYVPKKSLLSYEEMLRICRVLAENGVSKVRITGGEPFVRKGLVPFLHQLTALKGIEAVNITTNGVLTAPYIAELKAMGIKSVNLSLDTLDADRFYAITRRNKFYAVMDCLEKLLAAGIETKINTVVMDGQNIEDILPLVALAKTHPVSVRFIEEMPFNGEGQHYPVLHWTHKKILNHIQEAYPHLKRLPSSPGATSTNYEIPGFQGNFGIIAAFSRTFCGSCNRIRMTAQGDLKTCLYGDPVLQVRDLMRSGASDETLLHTFKHVFQQRARDGFEAEQLRASGVVTESMSTIGG